MDSLKQFVDGIGIFCETWLVAYNKFVASGLDDKTALAHTREFMTAFITSASQTGGGKDGS